MIINKVIQCFQSRIHDLWQWFLEAFSFWCRHFLRPLISVGRLFLNSGVLSEEALPPAVASLDVCRVACVCRSVSFSPLHHFLFSSLRFPQHNKESPLFSSVLDQSHLFTVLPNLCLFPFHVSLFPTLCPPLAPFPLSLSLSHRPPPASDWQCYKLIFSPVCSPCLSLGISLI